MTTLYLDIETCPSMAWVWSTGKQYIAHGQILEDTRIICVAYKWEGKREKAEVLTWDSKQCDKRMLTKLSKIVDKAHQCENGLSLAASSQPVHNRGHFEVV